MLRKWIGEGIFCISGDISIFFPIFFFLPAIGAHEVVEHFDALVGHILVPFLVFLFSQPSLSRSAEIHYTHTHTHTLTHTHTHSHSNVTWVEALSTVGLAVGVCIVAALLLSLVQFYQGFWIFWFTFVVGTAHFSLIKVSLVCVCSMYHDDVDL